MSQPEKSIGTSFDSLYQCDKGSEHLFDMTFQERQGAGGLFTTDGFTLIDVNFAQAPGAAKWSHYNDRSLVEFNFVLAGTLVQSHSGLFNRQLYATGYSNCLF